MFVVVVVVLVSVRSEALSMRSTGASPGVAMATARVPFGLVELGKHAVKSVEVIGRLG
jgi:hypothetical protein